MDKNYSLKKSHVEKILKEYNENFNMEAIDNVNFLVGTNAASNWEIYRSSSQTGTVFHLDKFSSPYVIIDLPIDQLTPDQIMAAAFICKAKTKYKNVPNIGVLYTSISNTVLGEDLGSFIIKSKHKKKLIIV